ncbi:hypothetical protein DER45DRAFT_256466 [Fusarium avenaceum]|nr:hypothetical protein DER45DRAFT_256466 [Fusarium avenaceum]
MHSAIFALVAITGLASAGPTAQQTECQGVGQFFVCANNGFRGWCSNDPCDKKWCSDFVEKTCDPVFITEPPKGKVPEPEDEGHWEETVNPVVLPEGQCAPNTGFFQSCSNGFRGCCKSDACSGKAPICPPTVAKRQTDPTVCPPGSGFFQSCSNGFRGCCKGDACAGSWCPDAQTLKVKVRSATAASSDGTCRPGTGFFQVCSNGFKGCCKKDACAGKRPVCPK